LRRKFGESFEKNRGKIGKVWKISGKFGKDFGKNFGKNFRGKVEEIFVRKNLRSLVQSQRKILKKILNAEKIL